MGWFAGQAGDAGDQGIAFGAGFADNVTLGASWLWRDSLGTDTVDYGGTAYSAGGWTAFAVQLPGAVKAGLTGVRSAYAFATATDDVGRCANTVSKLVLGGCFVSGTLVTLSDITRDKAFESAIWNADGLQHDLLAEEFDRFDRTAPSVATASPRTAIVDAAVLVPISILFETQRHRGHRVTLPSVFLCDLCAYVFSVNCPIQFKTPGSSSRSRSNEATAALWTPN